MEHTLAHCFALITVQVAHCHACRFVPSFVHSRIAKGMSERIKNELSMLIASTLP